MKTNSSSTRILGDWSAVLATAGLALGLSAAVMGQDMDVTPAADTTLMFSGIQGGPFVAQTTNFWTIDDLDNVGLDFTVGSDQLWVSPLPNGGTVVGPGTANVSALINSAVANSLAPGNYYATVTFNNVTNGVGSTTRQVLLSVAPASFTASPLFINLSAVQGGNSPAPVTVTLTNTGAVDLNYTLTPTSTNNNWYALSKSAGTVPSTDVDTFDLTFNTPGLAAGNYVLAIDAKNTTTNVNNAHIVVTLNVASAPPGAAVTPNEDLSVTGPAGFLPGALKTYTLNNSSTRNVSWSASSSVNWLSIEPSGGVLAPNDGNPGGADEITVTVRVLATANTLAPGNFVGNVTFTDTSTSPSSVLGARAVYLTANPILTISPVASGGTIVAQPAGTPVPAAGPNKYEYGLGTVVSMQMQLDSLYALSGWVGDIDPNFAQSNPISITMNANKAIGANVARLVRTLNMSVNGTGTGTISPNPTGSQFTSALVQGFIDGTTVSLSAQADAGAVFTGWSGNVPDGHSNDNPLVVDMDRDRNISATFQQIVHVNLTTSGNGTATISPAVETYYSGLPVTLTATPASGSSFSKWTGDVSTTTASVSLVLSGDLNAQAVFQLIANDGGTDKPPTSNTQNYSLAVQVVGSGTVTPNSGTFTSGATVELVATPDPGFDFVGWSGDASGTDLATNVTFSKNLQVVATFAENQSGAPTPTTPAGLCGAGMASSLGLTMLLLAGANGARRTRVAKK